MLRIFILLLAMATGSAGASESLEFGPEPKWIATVEAPTEATAATKGQALAIRLLDNQHHFREDGALETFQHVVLQVNDAAALQAAGTVSVTWQPVTQRATVHKVNVYRDGNVIDVLAGEAKFETLQREIRLEQGFISGDLTAVLMIPALRVGDRIEVLSSVIHRDPALNAHMELLPVVPVGMLADRIHILLSWPQGRDRNLAMGAEWRTAKRTRIGDRERLTLDIESANLPTLPFDAPARYQREFAVAISDHQGWHALSRMFAQSYDAAATIDAGTPLNDIAAGIEAEHRSDTARAEAALRLVQGDVRYLFRNYDLGGFTPRTAEQVWEDRQGDCKGKSVLLVALLRRFGIEADPVMVRAIGSGLTDIDVPAAFWFDHVIVRARIGDETYWLDGTRMGDDLASGLTPPPYRHVLPITTAGSELVTLPQAATAKPAVLTTIDVDMSAGLETDAAVSGSIVYRDDRARGLDLVLLQAGDARREEVLMQFAASQFNWIDIDSATILANEAEGTSGVTFTGTVEIDWNLKGQTGYYNVPYSRLGRDLVKKRQITGPYADIPTQVEAEHVASKVTLHLPPGEGIFSLDGEVNIDRNIGPARYRRHAELNGNVLTLSRSTQIAPAELTLAEAKAADKESDDLWAERLRVRVAGRAIPVMAGNENTGPDHDIKTALLADKQIDWNGPYSYLIQPEEAEDVLRKLDALDDAAAETEPALSMRVTSLSILGRQGDADAANERLLADFPQSRNGLQYRFDRLFSEARYQDAEIVADRIILAHPESEAVYANRAEVRAAQQNYVGAASDVAIHLRRQPDDVNAYIFQADILSRLDRVDDALASVDAWLASDPSNNHALALKANLLVHLDGKDEARSLARQIIGDELGNGALLILNYKLWETPKERRDAFFTLVQSAPRRVFEIMEEFDAILADPDVRNTYFRHIAEQEQRVAGSPDDEDETDHMWTYPFLRAIAGDRSAADAMLANATDAQRAEIATYWNNICWNRATAGTRLQEARIDCQRALSINRDPAYLDSLALVELSSDKPAAALSLYEEALAETEFAYARFGRGLALFALGREAEAIVDIAKAKAEAPTIAENYRKYAVVLPAFIDDAEQETK
ncbi:DUF3857 domain-containing protein [Pacificimonas sp. WHA3]|uniref:DUF3857 domain-containing protein n=1 Tax=Pacificimonas pallii TaxID=2827236 RepID=A0ABS6SFU2_9SPHN|nr:DUF3857 domain-containing transglutaminase family protein [Pacificimonas pallii]MBV7257245.1 DUF3857 domain-containing protein [Pacificimonas pallii]